MKYFKTAVAGPAKVRHGLAGILAALCAIATTNRALAQPPIAPPQAAAPTPGPNPVFNTPSAAGAAPQPRTQPANFLAWEAEAKTYEAKSGELTAHFTFYVTNVSAEVVVITSLQRSCGCTEASMPAQPWNLAAGTNGAIQATIDLRGKAGIISKPLTVHSSAGSKVLTLTVSIPPATNANPMLAPNPPALPARAVSDTERARNQQSALLDRQAVFKGECASCHAEPTVGKLGLDLYQAGCAICHDAANRAAMVPDLRTLKHALDAEQWKQWITASQAGSMMPAFAKAHGGPLSDEQIGSLVDYLTRAMRNDRIGGASSPEG